MIISCSMYSVPCNRSWSLPLLHGNRPVRDTRADTVRGVLNLDVGPQRPVHAARDSLGVLGDVLFQLLFHRCNEDD